MAPSKRPSEKLPDISVVSIMNDADDDNLTVDIGELDEYAAFGMMVVATYNKLMELLPSGFGYDPDDDDDED